MKDWGPGHALSDKSLSELHTFTKVTKWRIQQLRAGSRLWAYAYFERYTMLSSSGPEVPQFVQNLRAKGDEVVKYALSKFGELSEVSAKLKEYVGTVMQRDADVNQHGVQTLDAIKSMASGVSGMSASVRVEQDAAAQHRGATTKLLRESAWRIAGQGNQQTRSSLKELLINGVRLDD